MAYQPQTRCYTKTITAPITINQSDNVKQISVAVISGSCNILGDGIFQGSESDAITLSTSTISNWTMSAESNAPLNGITITPSGTVLVTLVF